jgi:hypothetical protein
MPLQFDFCPQAAKARKAADTTSKEQIRFAYFIQLSCRKMAARRIFLLTSRPLSENSLDRALGNSAYPAQAASVRPAALQGY